MKTKYIKILFKQFIQYIQQCLVNFKERNTEQVWKITVRHIKYHENNKQSQNFVRIVL